VRVNGVNLNVKKTGSGPPVVALHGFGGNRFTWAEFAQEAQNEYTVITIDLLGHGDSDSPIAYERYSLEHSVADITAVLEKLGVSRACWLGYSMGGRIALAAATSNPSMCQCLVLEGASPGLIARDARARRKRNDEALASLIMKEGVEAFVNYWERRPLFDSQRSLPRSVREGIRTQRLRNNPIGLANTLRAASPGVQPPLHKLLRKLRIPVLCVAGQYDHKFTGIAREMCGKLRYGKLAIIPGAGHATHIEKPREFNTLVLAFLGESCKPATDSEPPSP
jgi:2-succinyl-6-hydroxy-2,4-cyclohexadiene-1-carboxylate synthase